MRRAAESLRRQRHELYRTTGTEHILSCCTSFRQPPCVNFPSWPSFPQRSRCKRPGTCPTPHQARGVASQASNRTRLFGIRVHSKANEGSTSNGTWPPQGLAYGTPIFTPNQPTYTTEGAKPMKTTRHPSFMDITGDVYGRWTVFAIGPWDKKRHTSWWWCRCECGTERLVMRDRLREGRTKGCGCLIAPTLKKKRDDAIERRKAIIKAKNHRICLTCNAEFVRTSHSQRNCSPKCREANRQKCRKSWKEKNRAIIKRAPIGNLQEIAKWEATWRTKRRVTCHWCGKHFPGRKCHADHVMPLSKGGAHAVENLCISCSSCNLHKLSKHPEKWNKELEQPLLFT